MEHKHYVIEVGYDDDNGVVDWVQVTDGYAPLDSREAKIFSEAVRNYEYWRNKKD